MLTLTQGDKLNIIKARNQEKMEKTQKTERKMTDFHKQTKVSSRVSKPNVLPKRDAPLSSTRFDIFKRCFLTCNFWDKCQTCRHNKNVVFFINFPIFKSIFFLFTVTGPNYVVFTFYQDYLSLCVLFGWYVIITFILMFA